MQFGEAREMSFLRAIFCREKLKGNWRGGIKQEVLTLEIEIRIRSLIESARSQGKELSVIQEQILAHFVDKQNTAFVKARELKGHEAIILLGRIELSRLKRTQRHFLFPATLRTKMRFN